MKTLYFDESGYTGHDLLNTAQPIFTIASSDVGNDEAAELLHTAFPHYQGAEFKFTSVWRRSTHRKRLPKFGELVGKMADRAFIYLADKKFTALSKVVDTLAEPLAHSAGYDFYAGGYARRYTNMFHFALEHFAPRELYNSILSTYDHFSRNPTEETLARLRHKYRLIANSCPEELESFMGPIALGAELYSEFNNIELQKGSNDIQFTCILSSVSHWRSKTDADIAVVHDSSSNFFRQKEYWERVTSPDLMPASVVGGDGSTQTFPLRVVSTEPGDSDKLPALQLCDLIAGIATKRPPEHSPDGRLLKEILDAGFGELTFNGIRPAQEFVEGLPEKLSVDMVDQFLAAISNTRPK